MTRAQPAKGQPRQEDSARGAQPQRHPAQRQGRDTDQGAQRDAQGDVHHVHVRRRPVRVTQRQRRPLHVPLRADQVQRVAAVHVPAGGERHLPARAGQPGDAHPAAVGPQQLFQRLAVGRLAGDDHGQGLQRESEQFRVVHLLPDGFEQREQFVVIAGHGQRVAGVNERVRVGFVQLPSVADALDQQAPGVGGLDLADRGPPPRAGPGPETPG